MASEDAYRQVFCRGIDCGAMFFICRPCDRGQAYCGDDCRFRMRRQQRRQANQRYEQDPEVRRDHCERQRDYRRRRQLCRVTDQSSILECGSGSITALLVKTEYESPAAEEEHEPPKPMWGERLGRVVCLICRRLGKFVAAFVRRE